jgi:SAM-dependent methyltransferase
MKKRLEYDFDSFGEGYHQELDLCLKSLGGRDSKYYNKLKADWTIKLCDKYLGNISQKDFLDLGCGTGLTEKNLIEKFNSGVGLDLSYGMIEAGVKNLDNCSFVQADASKLPFPDQSFDLVLSITFLHHVSDENIHNIMKESKRVLKNGGMIIHFDHNPYNFLTRKVVEYCVFDEGETLLRPRKTIENMMKKEGLKTQETGYIAFIPASLKILEPIEKSLKKLPLGAQYFIASTI